MNPQNSNPAALASPGSPPALSGAGVNGTPLEDCGKEGNTAELAYNPVPPKRTVTVSLRCRIRGRGLPLHYPVEEGNGE
jgi:hypothetical protein